MMCNFIENMKHICSKNDRSNRQTLLESVQNRSKTRYNQKIALRVEPTFSIPFFLHFISVNCE